MADRMFLEMNFEVTDDPFGSAIDYYQAFADHPGLMAWHKPTLANTTPDGSNRVSTYIPQAGTGTWTQPTSGQQPLYVPNYLNGESVLYLDSARHDFMTWGGIFPTGSGSKYTKIALVQPDSALAGHQGNLLSYQQATSQRHVMKLGGQFQTAEIDVANSGLTANTPQTIPYSGAWYLVISGFDGGPGGSSNTVFIQVNQTTGTTVTAAGFPGSPQLCLGAADSTGSTSTYLGHYADDWIYNHAVQSDVDMADVIQLTLNYCLAEYGLPLNY